MKRLAMMALSMCLGLLGNAAAVQAQPTPEGPVLVFSGYGQERTSVAVAYIVENVNPDFLFRAVPVQVSVFNSAGSVIGADSDSVSRLYPAAKMANISRVRIPEGETAARVELTIGKGRAMRSAVQSGFEITDIVYRAERNSRRATGLVTSSFPQSITEVRVVAVAFDASGSIIGGGSRFVGIVPGGGSAATDVDLTISAEPAWIEMYAAPSGLSDIE
jgi:hypothetical protein